MLPVFRNITVTGGTGSAFIVATGIVNAVGFIPPSESAVYDVNFVDIDGFGIHGDRGLIGSETIRDEFSMWDRGTLTISNASVDGVYKFKLWFTTFDR